VKGCSVNKVRISDLTNKGEGDLDKTWSFEALVKRYAKREEKSLNLYLWASQFGSKSTVVLNFYGFKDDPSHLDENWCRIILTIYKNWETCVENAKGYFATWKEAFADFVQTSAEYPQSIKASVMRRRLHVTVDMAQAGEFMTMCLHCNRLLATPETITFLTISGMPNFLRRN
jgi:hypothetical protein